MGADSKNTLQDTILDTCVLQYFGNVSIKPELRKYLLELIERNFGLAISEVSYAELLTNLSKSKEQDGQKILQLFKRYPVNANVLVASAQLSSLYNQVQIDNKEKIDVNTDHVSFADRVIASTSVLSNSLILTANIQDFPNPYFIPVEEKKIYYKKSLGRVCFTYSFFLQISN